MLARKPMAPSQGSKSAADDQAKDAIAAVLRTLAEYALPTVRFPVEPFVESCERLAREVLLRIGGQKKGDPPRPLGQVYLELRNVVREQRQAESQEYSAHKESAKVIVSGLVSKLRQAFATQEGQDDQTLRKLVEMEQAVAEGDITRITELASKTAEQIRQAIDLRREHDQDLLVQLSGELRKMREDLNDAREQAQHDGLTGMFNRAAFDQAFAKTVSLARASGIELSVFMLDLDLFKLVNDRFGHDVGDRVLRACADALVRSFPRRDDFVARYGGEEFVVLCRGVGAEHAPMLAERVRRSVANLTVQTEDAVISPTISVGYAQLGEGETGESFLRRADQALYHAKDLGRDRVCGAEPVA